MAQIERTGTISFHDASLHIWEEGPDHRWPWPQRTGWERTFKKQVLHRIVQTLNRLGWTCVIPQEMVKQYSCDFARNHRYCVKGDLKADLSLSGRCIELKMFQSVNTPDRPDHEGRYQSEKEEHMPYLLWLEMERTRLKIKKYLCNVFTGYAFKSGLCDGRANKCGPEHLTNMEWLEGCYKSSCHFKGDISTYKIDGYNRKSADKQDLEHGQRVWFFDRKGRVQTGTAYYNINNMWWVLWGKYGHTNRASFDLFTELPEAFKKKRNGHLRLKMLNSLMTESMAAMNFERSIILRDLIKAAQPV